MIEEMSVAILGNGLRVANFASPHDFTFQDGTVLKGSSIRAEAFSVARKEVETPREKWTDVEVRFLMTVEVAEEIERCRKKALDEGIDIILISFPTLSSLKAANIEVGPFRTLSMVSRTEKKLCIDKFCR